MPIYEYECRDCGAFFEQFQRAVVSSRSEVSPPCARCASQQTQRLISRVAVLKNAGPGIGRAAYPVSWARTNQGDADTVRYWRERVEKEQNQEAKDPGLVEERRIRAERRYDDIVRRERAEHGDARSLESNPAPASGPGHSHPHTHDHGHTH